MAPKLQLPYNFKFHRFFSQGELTIVMSFRTKPQTFSLFISLFFYANIWIYFEKK
jgi:hypothetical protein